MPRKSKTDLLLESILETVSSSSSDLKNLSKTVGNVELDTAKNTVTLIEHMKRSAANEASLALLREESDKRIGTLEGQLEPIKTHVAAWGGVGKGLAILVSLATVVTAAYEVWPWLSRLFGE